MCLSSTGTLVQHDPKPTADSGILYFDGLAITMNFSQVAKHRPATYGDQDFKHQVSPLACMQVPWAKSPSRHMVDKCFFKFSHVAAGRKRQALPQKLSDVQYKKEPIFNTHPQHSRTCIRRESDQSAGVAPSKWRQLAPSASCLRFNRHLRCPKVPIVSSSQAYGTMSMAHVPQNNSKITACKDSTHHRHSPMASTFIEESSPESVTDLSFHPRYWDLVIKRPPTQDRQVLSHSQVAVGTNAHSHSNDSNVRNKNFCER